MVLDCPLTGLLKDMNQFIYNFAVWLDTHPWSTALHESFYLYNWIETTHVLSLMISLGLLFDCAKQPPAFIGSLAGCIADQSRF